MRKAHILQRTTKQNTPNRLVFFDTESSVDMKITDDEVRRVTQHGELVVKNHELYLICASFIERRRKNTTRRRTYMNGDMSHHFWADVVSFSKTNEKTWVFAHNAKYDTLVTNCVSILSSFGFRLEMFSDTNPFIFRFRMVLGEKRSKVIMVVSTTNYFAMPLAKIGRAMGLSKLDFDHGETFERTPAFMEKAIIYCARDVEIIERVMLEFLSFIQDQQLGSFQMTTAGQAFAAYRMRFLPVGLHIHTYPEPLRVERDSYCGGRTECFHIGEKKNIFYHDVNSMYPHVMKTKRFPYRLWTFRKRMSVEDAQDLLERGYGLAARCYIDTDVPCFHQKGERLIFPTGSFYTTLTTGEIEFGISRGYILSLENVCVYEMDDLFSEYVDFFYTRRVAAKSEGRDMHELFYKNMLNSLYGKFGQLHAVWEPVGETSETGTERVFDVSDMTSYMLKKVGGTVFRKTDDEEAYNSFPVVAAHVTAYARMLMWELIEIAGLEHVFYVDTDSIVSDACGHDRLLASGTINDRELGKLKLEAVGDILIHGSKDYELHTADDRHVVKMKGIPSNPAFRRKLSEGRYVVAQWTGYSTYLQEGTGYKYHQRLIEKQLLRKYHKGIVHIDGTVSPIRLSE